MRNFRFIWVAGIIVTTLIVALPILLLVSASPDTEHDPWAFVPERLPHTDHTHLMDTPFESGSEVTLACLACHEDAAYQLMQTTHWTWQAPPVEVAWSDEPVSTGKANVLNNFCIGIQSNWTGCTSCHAGYGWDGPDFDFSNQENVDCLVCHDQSGMYVKGNSGQPVEGVDLLTVAQSVGIPTRENCGSCHFNGGGGNAVKHGDMDETLYFPNDHIDVHMGGLDFQCIDCHQTEEHLVAGRSISVSVDDANQIYCTDCHTGDLHEDQRINAHTENIACQTCHVPFGAVRDATKMFWDWSEAGSDDIEEDVHEYLKIKGSFVYESSFTPAYTWFNGDVERYLIGDIIDPAQTTILNQPQGDIDDSDALIWPFKIHGGNQIYDSVYNYLLQPQTVGDGGYWTEFDWDQAVQLGSEVVGLEYSGEYGFAPTEMYWPLSHMVQPAHHALQCNDCHGDTGRMDWEALGYYGDPMRWGGRDD